MSKKQPQIAEWDLRQTNLSRLRENNLPRVAVLPTAAIEAHNNHLPQGQDLLHTSHVARRCTERAWQSGAQIICLPAIPYGVDCNLLDFPLTIHISQSTLDQMVRDIVVSLHHHGIKRIVLLNGHGGNDFKPLIRQLQCDLDVHLFVCDWWKVGMDRYADIFENPDDHAGELETSVALHLYPHLVEMEKAGPGSVPPFRFEALNRGWVQTSRRFMRLNDHCSAGNPRQASAEKGRRYLELVCERISAFLVELSAAEADDVFPLAPADG